MSETDEPDYPQMERTGLYLEDPTVYQCNNCGRYMSIPNDQARPVACPYQCSED